MDTRKIRQKFLSFFSKNNHTIVPSASLIPRQDPTLLFVNAGMVPFKEVFIGNEKRPYTRATSSQKCVRAGGKHNDLENVGYTKRHHTFFEMLGNFSFGDYFKEQALLYAWTFIVEDLGIPPQKLSVTFFEEDTETQNLWRKISGLPTERIIPMSASNNFWSMGETGPCGPCAEIFYDHGPQIRGGPPGSPDEDGDRFVEIWNLVFMTFDQQSKNSRIPLSRRGIDTGMGLERIAAVLQGVTSNYDTDILRALVEQTAHLTGTDIHSPLRTSLNVIADHIRTSAFLMADGVLPSSEGRGYVLRRILRRAMRHAYLLGEKDPLLVKLVPTLLSQMGTTYPELYRAESLIKTNIKLEERRFQKTFEHGLHLLQKETEILKPGDTLPGQIAFKLYDTYGFPLDLTQDIVKEKNLKLGMEAFNQEMANQREIARASWVGSGEQLTERTYIELAEQIPPTVFLGYDQEESEAQIQALLHEGAFVSELHADQEGLAVMNPTPFYAESGGQIGDRGWWQGINGACGTIRDTQKKKNITLHKIHVQKGILTTDQKVFLRVDSHRRQNLKRNHSTTHLLHQALRQILGDHVSQRGSLVTAEKLRFDFSHAIRLTLSELEAIEDLVNKHIRQNLIVETQLMKPEKATQEGALALFGEKYGSEVRVVTMGPTKNSTDHPPFSKELCGGTHVDRTGDIGYFKILSDSSIASGIRRIEAITGHTAVQYVQELSKTLQTTANSLKTTSSQIPFKINSLLTERRLLQQEITSLKERSLQSLDAVHETLASGLEFVHQQTKDSQISELKKRMDNLKKRLTRGIICVGQKDDDKTTVLLGVVGLPTHAGKLLQETLTPYGGKGGGRADLAQGGWSGPPSLEVFTQSLRKKIDPSL